MNVDIRLFDKENGRLKDWYEDYLNEQRKTDKDDLVKPYISKESIKEFLREKQQ